MLWSIVVALIFLNIQGKLVFDGSIENLDCIIQHEAVLEKVTPLLRCKNGRSYRRRSGVDLYLLCFRAEAVDEPTR